MAILDLFWQQKLLDSYDGGRHLDQARQGRRELSEGALQDVEDHDGREGNCGIDFIAEVDVGQESKEDDEGAAQEVQEDDWDLEESSSSVGFQFCAPFLVDLFVEILLKGIYFDEPDDI